VPPRSEEPAFPGNGDSRKKILDPGTDSRVYNADMNDNKQERPLRSGELARLAGVSADTLRHYERKGLLAPGRSENGYREYSVQALERVRLVQRALSIGFTLDELARLLQTRDRGGAPCRQVRALASAKLEAIEAQICSLTALREEMRALLEEWDRRLAETPQGERAWLLESWNESPPPDGERRTDDGAE
jgi:DNA-binding transcriptional MerR regulator